MHSSLALLDNLLQRLCILVHLLRTDERQIPALSLDHDCWYRVDPVPGLLSHHVLDIDQPVAFVFDERLRLRFRNASRRCGLE
jgi:hypothetical protein